MFSEKIYIGPGDYMLLPSFFMQKDYALKCFEQSQWARNLLDNKISMDNTIKQWLELIYWLASHKHKRGNSFLTNL